MSTALVTAAEVAAATVSVLSPYLTEAGKEVAKAAGKEAASQGFKVLGWLRDKLTGTATGTLAALEEKPENQNRQGAFKFQLADFLEENPALLDELRKLLAEAAPGIHGVSQTVKGDNNNVGQVVGSGSTITITR
ncbi:hypothetical protein [Azospirillum doebereinerae]|uniref:Uncharacterized protein n=1 Tax=Azospirillum doebereinerae TaxID=92933 RepID=A0A3S1CD42_9PROT|nr:hypothetical protein [Azospirillum doebereinerae]RUQ61992.1 hypothetical protein EJ913_29370 [Azospirillum doebereinerae]